MFSPSVMALIGRLRIILNNVEPMPMRHTVVTLKIGHDRLNEFIQAAKTGTDTRFHEFHVGDAGWALPEPTGFYDSPVDAKKITLEKLLHRTITKTIQYVYDFGNDWDPIQRSEKRFVAYIAKCAPSLASGNPSQWIHAAERQRAAAAAPGSCAD